MVYYFNVAEPPFLAKAIHSEEAAPASPFDLRTKFANC